MAGVESEALVLDEDLTLRLATVHVPEPEPSWARIRVEWAGICGSDLHTLRTGDWVTRLPVVLGHEVVGRVDDCPGRELAPGTRVAVDPRVGCGVCDGCHRSPFFCERLQWVGDTIPGGFQRYANYPVRSLVPVLNGVDGPVGVLVEPLATIMRGIDQLREVPDRALIIGYGTMGALTHTELLRRNPHVEVTVRARGVRRTAFARAQGALIENDDTPADWPLIVDAAGVGVGFGALLDSVGRLGQVLVVGVSQQLAQIDPNAIVDKQLRIVGAQSFVDEFASAVALVGEQPEHYRPLVTDEIPLAAAPAGIAALFAAGAAGKVVLQL